MEGNNVIAIIDSLKISRTGVKQTEQNRRRVKHTIHITWSCEVVTMVTSLAMREEQFILTKFHRTEQAIYTT
jgi:hypothetical protein